MRPLISTVSRLSSCERFLIRRRLSSWLRNAEETKLSDSTEKLFSNPDVQGILKKLTGVSFEKVFEPRPQEKPENPFYRLMTSEELEKMKEDAQSAASGRLQTPPMVECVPEEGKVLSVDEDIAGFDSSSFIFTDITYGISDKDRTVAVREPDGTLRTASCQEKERMIRLYFPKPHRNHETPQAFFQPHLQDALEMNKHVHILDWACIQFEPYDPQFARVSRVVFDHVNLHKSFELLWSTRHCGNMLFYLVINKEVENYLIYLANERRMEEMVDVVRLYNLCHSDSKSAPFTAQTEDPWKIIQNFIDHDVRENSPLGSIVLSLQQENNSNKLASS